MFSEPTLILHVPCGIRLAHLLRQAGVLSQSCLTRTHVRQCFQEVARCTRAEAVGAVRAEAGRARLPTTEVAGGSQMRSSENTTCLLVPGQLIRRPLGSRGVSAR